MRTFIACLTELDPTPKLIEWRYPPHPGLGEPRSRDRRHSDRVRLSRRDRVPRRSAGLRHRALDHAIQWRPSLAVEYKDLTTLCGLNQRLDDAVDLRKIDKRGL